MLSENVKLSINVWFLPNKQLKQGKIIYKYNIYVSNDRLRHMKFDFCISSPIICLLSTFPKA